MDGFGFKLNYYTKAYNLTDEEKDSLLFSNPEYFIEDIVKGIIGWTVCATIIKGINQLELPKDLRDK